MHSPELIKLIDDNKYLFWSISREDLDKISLDAVVENFLNNGDVAEIRKLIELVGIQEVARIFYRQISRSRINYHKRTIEFFIHYFKRHAPGNIIT